MMTLPLTSRLTSPYVLMSMPGCLIFVIDLMNPLGVWRMVKEVRSQSTQLRVIVVTGYPSLPTAMESFHLNVLEYLIKPIDYTVLLAAIKQGFQRKQILRSI